MPVTADEERRSLLALDRVVVVGCSSTPGKEAHEIPRYLREHGYEVVPVNPFADEIFGDRTYDSLVAVPDAIDIVLVFRPSEELAGIVEVAIERGDVTALWTQRGIRDSEAVRTAENAGISVVHDECIRSTHQRLAR